MRAFALSKLSILSFLGLSSAHPPTPQLAVLGDSTVAEYPNPNFPAVSSYLKGVYTTSLAIPGQTIAQQKAVWLANDRKTDFDIIVIQVGLNDMSPDIPFADTARELQSLVDAVNREKRPSATVAIAQLNPALDRWRDLFGERSSAAFLKWKAFNQAVAGHGPVPISGVNVRILSHVQQLATPAGALRSEFNALQDGIHPDAKARKIVACAWATGLQKANFAITC